MRAMWDFVKACMTILGFVFFIALFLKAVKAVWLLGWRAF